MIRFAQSEYLSLLFLLPALVLFFWAAMRMRKKALGRFAEAMMVAQLSGPASRTKPLVKSTLLLLVVGLLVLGIANPQIGTRLEEVKLEGIDLFIALDVSLSMKAEDIKPNRLEKSKLEIRNLIDRLRGDRIGLIVFAGDAYTQFPLTTDYTAAYLFLDVVDTDAVPSPGTSIGSAIRRALESFDFNEPTTKALVIITDGENTEGDAFEVATEAGAKGLKLYTIGMGSPAGSPIPLYDGSGRQVDFKRDRGGSIVVTKLDEIVLERIADAGKGKYYRGTTAQDELDEIFEDINALQKREFGAKQFVDYEDRFQYFLGAVLVLLLAETLTTEVRSRWIPRWMTFRREEEIAV